MDVITAALLTIEAAANAWHGKFEIKLAPDIELEIKAVMNRLAHDYPSLAAINVVEGDSDAMERNGIGATKSLTSLILNIHQWNHKKIAEKAKEWDELMVDATLAGVILHECGHILDNQVLRKLGSKKYNALVAKYVEEFGSISNMEAPSPYGQENLSEAIAEMFVSHYIGKHAMRTIRNVVSESSMKVSAALWADFNRILK